jgi:HSP20 family molecular chaperone IbpA
MSQNKRSFFERLTGTVDIDDYADFEDDSKDLPIQHERAGKEIQHAELATEEETEGQLTVDVYQTPDEIVIRAIIAGVRPDELDVSITRDMVTIHGKRENHKEASDEDFFFQELYWGSFSRTILLPQEVEVEDATASEKHGLLTIRLPKIDKKKQTKLKVKAG